MLANASGIFADMAAGDCTHLPLSELTTLSIPVKILLGERSQALYRRVAEDLAARLATAELSVLSGSAHDMTFDQPTGLGAAVARLLGTDPHAM
jgi:pimeloyl-ACP methyl ester carboxylesterase